MSVPKAEDKPLLTVAEVAEILGWSMTTAYRRVSDGTLPTVRTGRRSVSVPTARLRDWLGLPVQ